MIFAVKHTISNPEEFWGRAQQALPNLPEGIKVHSVLPNHEGNDAVCIWEAESYEQINNFLESNTGDVSQNHYTVVNEEKAMGIPGR